MTHFFAVTLLCCNVYAADGVVSVSVAPGSRTVKVRGTQAAANNTAQYAITTSFDPNSLETVEVRPEGSGDWSITSTSEFIPPADFQGTPPSGAPNVAITGKDGTWDADVFSTIVGQWTITFTVVVKFKKYDKEKKTVVENEFLTAEGKGSCTFKATAGRFKVSIQPDDNFLGRRTKLGVGELGTIVVEKWDANDPDVVFERAESSNSNVIRINQIPPSPFDPPGTPATFGTGITAGDRNGSATLSVWAKGISEAETINLSVVEPQGIRMVFQDDLSKRPAQINGSLKYGGKNYKQVFIAAVGIKVFLDPTDVSFNKITITEGKENYKLEDAEIAFNKDNEGGDVEHKAWSKGVSMGDQAVGCHVLGPNLSPRKRQIALRCERRDTPRYCSTRS
ncbi:MAG: hypothetical protein ACRC2T_03290 [Thermoguttaceae bacterium]